MPNHRRVKDLLLDDYFQQWVTSPTPELDAYWQEYSERNPELRQEVDEARNILLQLDFQEQTRSEATKTNIKANIDRSILEHHQPVFLNDDSPRKAQIDHRKYHVKTWQAVAASLGGLILLVSIYFILFSAAEYTTYTTAFRETKRIMLPDSSMVTLNANSKLRLQEENWTNTSQRKLWLEGEAFFEVKKVKTPQGEAAKFIVYSGDVNVEVLGTSFNVNNRHQETKVVLSSGSVKLNLQEIDQREKEIMMLPGDMVLVNKAKREISKKVVDTSYYTSWKENRLQFDHTPLSEIFQLIRDNYGLEVSVLSERLTDRAFTGTAPADQLDILLDKISVVYNLKIERNENEIMISEK